MVCLVEESSHRASKQRSDPVHPVVGEVAKDSSWTKAVGWLSIKMIEIKGEDRLSFYFLNVHLRAGFILDPVRGTAKRWQAATVRPEREKASEKE